MSEHRLSLMTATEKVEHAMEVGDLPAIAGLTDRLAAYAAAREDAQNPRWSREEQARRLAEVEAGLHPDIDGLVERAMVAATRDLDQEEGELRVDAGFGAEIEAGVGVRATLMATQAATAADPTAAIAVFGDAEFTSNTDLIRSVGCAVLTRLRELAAKDAGLPQSPARNALLGFEGRWQAWQRANPSPRERIAALERERSNRRVRIEEGVRFALRLHGIGRPAPPPVLLPLPDVERARINEGPAFDLLARGGARR